jgi:tetratricopeptide (TPR) repeat protein
MLNSQETLTILERILDKDYLDNSSKKKIFLTNEETVVINNLLENYDSSNDLKLTLILRILLNYLNLFKFKTKLSDELRNNFKEIIKLIRFNQIELFLPCKNIEWILLEIGRTLLTLKESNKDNISLVHDLLETTADLFKIVDNEYGLAVTNYFMAYMWFIGGNREKSARLLEMVAHLFKNPLISWESQYNAALLNYPFNLKRSINLLENCLLIAQKNQNELIKSNISINKVEKILNSFRRDYIIRYHAEDVNFLFSLIEKVINFYHTKNDILSLSACYYEAGIILDKLGYAETAEEYFVEVAIITAEQQQWKLYSKSLINLVVKFFEKGRISEAEEYLNDLIQIASILKDDSLHKKVETLLLSLKKIKEISPSRINSKTNLEQYISEIDDSTQIIPNIYVEPIDHTTENSIEINNQGIDSNEIESALDDLAKVEITQNFELSNSIDGSFLNDIKEPIIANYPNDIIVFNDEMGPPITQQENDVSNQQVQSFHSLRKKTLTFLRENNFETFVDYRPVKGSVSVDIVALRGKIRKHKLFIMVASDGEGEIDLSINLLLSIFDSAERIVLVNSLDQNKSPVKKGGVLVIYNINDIPI